MKALLTLLLICLFGIAGFTQDTPQTAIETFHRWAQVNWENADFMGASDSPESDAVGADIWFKLEAISSTFNLWWVAQWSGADQAVERQLFDQNLTSIPCSSGSDCDSWTGLNIGEDYYLSFTIDSLVIDQLTCFGVSVQDDAYVRHGDFNGDWIVSADDLLPLLAVFGEYGKFNADHDYDEVVTILDLVGFLPVFGQPAQVDPCFE